MSKKFKSIAHLCNIIFTLEGKYNLLDYDVDGVKLWQYLRMPMYYHIAEKHGVISSPHPDFKKASISQRITGVLSALKSLLVHNPLRCNISPDILLVDHKRSKKHNDIHIDIYSHFFIEQLTAEGKRLCIIEKPENGKHIRKIAENRKHLDILSLYRKYLILTGQVYPSKKIRKEIKKLSQLINKEFNLNTSVYSMLIAGYINYKSSYHFWKKVLIKQQPEKVVIVVSYIQLGGLIKAAKDLDIEVCELQHGVFSKYHLGYSFPNRKKELDYFPNTFLSWGSYWSQLIDLPVPPKNIVDIGFEYFHQMKNSYKGITRHKKQILILSQGVVSETLPLKLLSLTKELSNYYLIYKLHPSEYDTWKQNNDLIQLSYLNNFDIIDYDCDLYQKFVESEYQFGVFSTAIFEGIGMGCKTILFNLQGIEYMDKLLKSNIAILHDDKTNLDVSFEKADQINMENTITMLFSENTRYTFT